MQGALFGVGHDSALEDGRHNLCYSYCAHRGDGLCAAPSGRNCLSGGLRKGLGVSLRGCQRRRLGDSSPLSAGRRLYGWARARIIQVGNLE